MLEKGQRIKIGTKYAARMSYDHVQDMEATICFGELEDGGNYTVPGYYYVVEVKDSLGRWETEGFWDIHEDDCIPLLPQTNQSAKMYLDKEW